MTKKEKAIQNKLESIFQEVENLKTENKDKTLEITQLMTILNRDELFMTDELVKAKSEEVTIWIRFALYIRFIFLTKLTIIS